MVKHSSQSRACLLVPKTAARLIRLGHTIFPRPGLRRSGAVPHKEHRHQISDRSAAAFSRNPHFADLRPTTIAFALLTLIIIMLLPLAQKMSKVVDRCEDLTVKTEFVEGLGNTYGFAMSRKEALDTI